jgi:enoyl-CoA hydratase/carnithine racemase
VTSDVLLTDLDEHGVLLITFNRPERNNGWTLELELAYFDALEEAARNPAVRVTVVTGAGRAFCPGLDAQALEQASAGVQFSSMDRRPMLFPLRFPKPLIAAVNGGCAGIGLIQACCADLRFVADGAKLTTAFSRRGLPAEAGLSWLLPRMVGTGAAADLLLSGRVVTAAEALGMRLVERVYPRDELMAHTLAYARDMAMNCSPRSLATIKHQLLADSERSVSESIRAAYDAVMAMRRQPDFAEGVESYIDRRPPRFEPLSAEFTSS